jgi:gentisate 1,2-dioxygenase
MAATTEQQQQNSDSTELLLKSLEGSNTLPLWTQMARLNPPEPNPTAVPFIWKYQSIRPSLLRAGELITEKQAERRVLMLINPTRGTFAGENRS